MRSNSFGWFVTANDIRHTQQNVNKLPEEARDTLGSQEFKQWTIKSARGAIATSDGLVIFIGSGDISSQITSAIKANNDHILTLVIDSKISVGCRDADYLLWLN